MFTDMQRDKEVGEDAADVKRHEREHGVVAPFAGEAFLQRLPRRPQPTVFTVDREDVASDVVVAAGEAGERGVVGEEKGCMCVGLVGGLGFFVFHLVL